MIEEANVLIFEFGAKMYFIMVESFWIIQFSVCDEHQSVEGVHFCLQKK